MNRKALAYVVGVLYGDGTLNKTTRIKNNRSYCDYRIKLSVIDKDFADYFREQLTALKIKTHYSFEKSKVPKWRDIHTVQSQRRESYVFFLKYKTPSFIKSLNRKEKIECLKGLFDSEGSVSKDRYNINISQSQNSVATPLIAYLLKSLKIDYKLREQKRKGRAVIECDFRIFGIEIIKFHSLLKRFTIKRKEETYQKLLTDRQIERWDDKSLQFIYRNYKKMAHKELGEKLNRTTRSIDKKIWRLGLARKQNGTRS